MEAMGVKMMTMMMMKRKEVLGLMGVAILLILAGCLMPLTMAAQPSADVVCDRVKADIQPCLASGSPPPTPACCQGLKNIANLAANCVDDGLAAPNCVSKVCQCTKSSLSAQSGADFSNQFTGPCMVNIGFEVQEC